MIPAEPPPEPGGHLLFHVNEWIDGIGYTQIKQFMRRADPEFRLVAAGHPDVGAKMIHRYYAHATTNVREIHLHIPPAEYAKMKAGVPYRPVPRNMNEKYRWRIAEGVTLTR
jgi:hypothetical protein